MPSIFDRLNPVNWIKNRGTSTESTDNKDSSNTDGLSQLYTYGGRHMFNITGTVDFMKFPELKYWFYSPTYGQPRNQNLTLNRDLAKSNWIRMNVDTIVNAVLNTTMEIVPINDDIPIKNPQKKIELEEFFLYPSSNGDDISVINEKLIRDYYDIGDMVLVKVFNEGLYNKKSVQLEQNMWDLYKENSMTKGITLKKKIKTDNVIKAFCNARFVSKKLSNDKRFGLAEIRAGDASAFTKNVDRNNNYPFDMPAYFEYNWYHPKDGPKPYFKREVGWISNINSSGAVYGVSPIISLLLVLETMNAATRTNKLIFENGSIPDGIITLFTKNPKETRRFSNFFKNRFKNRPHKMLITGDEHKYTNLALSNKDMEYLEGQKFYKKIIQSLYHVPSEELGETSDSNKATSQGQSRVFIRGAVKPRLRDLERMYNNFVVPEFYGTEKPEYMVRFKYKDVFEEQMELDNDIKKVTAGLMPINEYRIKNGDKPVDWGDGDPRINKFSNGFMPSMTDDKDKKKDDDNNKNKEKAYEYYSISLKKMVKIVKGLENKAPSEKYYKGLKDSVNNIYDSLINEYTNIVKSGMSSADMIIAMTNLNNGVGIPQLDDFANSVGMVFDAGVSVIEKETNTNIVGLDKNSLLITYSSQIMYGYTVPSGKRWTGVKGLSTELLKEAVNILSTGLMDGKSPGAIGKEVQLLTGFSKYHSELIARTESDRILNNVEYRAAKKTGLNMVKEWNIVNDSRTGDDSKRMNGQVVGLDDYFIDPLTNERFFTTYHRPNNRCYVDYKVV